MVGLKRAVRWLGVSAAVLLIVAASLLLTLTVGRNRTPPIVDVQGGSLPGSVAELERRTIGGVEPGPIVAPCPPKRPLADNGCPDVCHCRQGRKSASS